MRRRTDRACWKCGQSVHHYRRRIAHWITGSHAYNVTPRKRWQVVPARHFIETARGFTVCPGSDRIS